jgi:hypothetical protein
LLNLFALGIVIQSMPYPRAAVSNQTVLVVHDWSMRQELYPLLGPLAAMLAVQQARRRG